MSHLALFLLGRPRVERDGELLKISRRKALALLAYLAVTGENPSRDELCALLWPGYDHVHSRASLVTTLSALRKAVGGRWLDANRKTVNLKQDAGLWVDVVRFRHLLRECQMHSHSPEAACSDCLTALTEAVGLYRGDFMTGFTLRDSVDFDDWQLLQTESLRREMIQTLDKLTYCHSALGQFEPAIAYARRQLALEPLHESAHRQLMRLYVWSEQRGIALNQYQECTRLLKSELGVPPEETTIQLYRDIKENRELDLPSLQSFASQPLQLTDISNYPIPFLTPLKKGLFHRQDAKSAKIFKQERENFGLYGLFYKEYSTRP